MTREQQFWNWFRENEAKYFFLNQIMGEEVKESLLDELLKQLHIYCNRLFFEVGGQTGKKQDFIITAEGDIDFFDKVVLLVKHAPKLEYWNIIAFKPVMENCIAECCNIKLDPKTMFFIPLSNKMSKKIGLRIYIDDYNSIKKEDFLTTTYLVLDNILGEETNALNIGYVDIEDLSSISKKEDLIELIKLPKYIEWKKTSKVTK